MQSRKKLSGRIFLVNFAGEYQSPPEEVLAREEAIFHLHSALERLTEKQRKAIKMCFGLDGTRYSLREASSELGISQTAVQYRLEHAINNLARMLSKLPVCREY